MGTLKPGATYIYERDGTTVYAREHGVGTSERKIVGWDHDSRLQDLMDNVLWSDIRLAAQNNPALQELLDKAIILYRLSTKNPK